MFKYLIIKCEELGDQWECDANRIPVCLTDDITLYKKRGYEIYEILPHGKFNLIKEYDEPEEVGFAVTYWEETQDFELGLPKKILEKRKGLTRRNVTRKMIQEIKAKYPFEGSVEEIHKEIGLSGFYGEDFEDGSYLVFGEYVDDDYSWF